MALVKRKQKVQSSSCLTKFLQAWAFLVIFLAVIFYSPIHKNLSSISDRRTLPETFDGPLKENDHLSRANHLFEKKIYGPESISPYKGDYYTGDKHGNIIKISNNNMEVFTNIGNDSCKNHWETRKCGRVLGTRVDTQGNLYFIDAYFGLKKVSLDAHKPTPKTLMASELSVNGHPSKFLDDLVIDERASPSNGNVVYMSDASKVWQLDEVILLFLDREESGRIIRYDEDANTASVVLDNLSFPNGVELSDDRSSLLVAELGKRRILRHYIKGPHKGTTQVLLDNLPGEPDNIRRSGRKQETFWVAIAFGRTQNQSSIFDYVDDLPTIRNLILRLIYAAGSLVEKFGQFLENPMLLSTGFDLKNILIFPGPILKTLRGMAIEFDLNGNIINCLHSPDGKTTLLSEVREITENNKRVLLLGSVINDYLGKLELN